MASFFEHCWDNNLVGVEDCLSKGTDVNTVTGSGLWSALTIAALESYPELLEILLSHPDIMINKTTDARGAGWPGYQWTALMFACDAGNPAIVSRLVEVPGVDIMYQDERGITAAHLASGRGHSECLRILAETGRVNWNRGDKWGETPLQRAQYYGHSNCVAIIVQQQLIEFMEEILDKLSTKKEFFRHSHDNNVKEVEDCLSKGTNVNMVSEDGHWSALTIAARKNYSELLEILLSHPDIKINKTTDARGAGWPGYQWTALMFACDAGNPAIVSRLVEVAGVDIMYMDQRGNTAALLASKRGHSECVRILEDQGEYEEEEHEDETYEDEEEYEDVVDEEDASRRIRTSSSSFYQEPIIAQGPTMMTNNESRSREKGTLRPVVVDGSNVAMCHGLDRVFSVRGISIVVEYFLMRGHEKVVTFLPQEKSRGLSSQDRNLLEEMTGNGNLVYTPSRQFNNETITSYDDTFILDYASQYEAVVVTRDNYRDLTNKKPDWDRVIRDRILMPTFVGDDIMWPHDPLGRRGVTLDDFLKF